MQELSGAAWRRSSKCEAGSCVEVADLDDTVGLRNSNYPTTAITFPVETWREFIAAVRAGEFDRQPA
jgi:hypothetical protein